MLSNIKIRAKLLVVFLLAAIIPTFLVTYVSLRQMRLSLTEVRFEQLQSVVDLKKENIETFFAQLESDMKVIQDYFSIKNNLPIVSAYANQRTHPTYLEAKAILDRQLKAWSKARGEIVDFMLTNTGGIVVYATNDWHAEEDLDHPLPEPSGVAWKEAQESISFTDVFRTTFTSNGFGMLVMAPAHDLAGNFIGVIVLEIDMAPLYAFIQDRTGLGDSGEMLMGRYAVDHALFLTPLWHDPRAALTRRAPYAGSDVLPITEATQGKAGKGFSVDYRSVPIMAAWVPLHLPSPLQWGLVAKVDTAEALAPVRALQRRFLFAVGIVLAVILVIASFVARSLSAPLLAARNAARAVSQGDLYVRLAEEGTDELSELGAAFNQMAEALQENRKKLEEQKEELARELRESEEQKHSLEEAKNSMIRIMDDLKTARNRIEQEAQNAKKFQQAVESSTDAILITNHRGEIIYVNPAWERLTGYTFYEVREKNPRILKSSQTSPAVFEKLWSTITRGRPFHAEIVNKRKNGSEFDAELDIYPIGEEGNIQFYVGVQHDITRRKRAEAAKSEFASLASHQLRTPLTAIRWALRRFKKEEVKLDQKSKHLLDEAQKATVRMADSIAAMLAVSRIEAGRIQLQEEDVPLHLLLSEIIQCCKGCYNDKKLSVSLECPDDLLLHTDRKLLTEVIENIVSNSFRYTLEGGSITVRTTRENDHCRIEVKDTGYGIPIYQQDKVFSKFFRADNAIEKQPDGTGLGLYLAHELTALLGGTVSFVSQEGKGTTFFLTLPLSA